MLEVKTALAPAPVNDLDNVGLLARLKCYLNPVDGRYEDLRRFLYDIETADELVYIEDVDLVPSATPHDHLTFNVKIVTYLRNDPQKPTVP